MSPALPLHAARDSGNAPSILQPFQEMVQRSLLVSLGRMRLSSDPCPSRNLGETHLQTQFRSRLFNSGTLGKSVASLNVWNKDSILVLIPCTVVKPRSARSILCPNAPCVSPQAWMASVRSPDPTPFAGSQSLVSAFLSTSRQPVPRPAPEAGLQPIPASKPLLL